MLHATGATVSFEAEMRVVIPDDDPPIFGREDHPDLVRLQDAGAEVTLHTSRWRDRAELEERIASANAVINVRAYTRFDAASILTAKHLRLISVLGTGVDNVDLEAAVRRGVTVCNTPAVASEAVAELAVGLLLAVARHIVEGDREIRSGIWRHHPGLELRGKTLGIVGFGSIGRHMAGLGGAIGMRVIIWNRTPPLGADVDGAATRVGFDELFRQADVVSIHLRHTPDTAGMVGRQQIESMKPGAILINTARAGVVDYAALADALRSGRLAGAGLDVHPTEPLTPERNMFADIPNAVLAPHTGSVTADADARSTTVAVDNVICFMRGTPQHVVAAG
jgi:phosphoglycerate dehydrogenase-like enzyme